MIETLFAGINGSTVIPGKKNFYASEYENACQVKVGPDDELALTYENGFSASFEETNVSKADAASIISCDGYGSWSYNILIPRNFVLDFVSQRGGFVPNINGGREFLVAQTMVEPMYAIYRAEVGTDRLVDFVPWMIKQINAYVARTFGNIYIDSYTFPTVRKIQYLNQNETIQANTDQGTQFGLSSTKYLRRMNMSYIDKTEIFYRLAIDVKTNPSTFEANNFRTNLTINDFDVHAARIDNFYVVHPKIEAIEKAYIDKSFNALANKDNNTIVKEDHLLFNGTEIYMSLLDPLSAPPRGGPEEQLIKEKRYYVINAQPNSFQLAVSPGGAAINIVNDYRVIAVYKAGVPLTINNYPVFYVLFGTSKLYQAPTISNFTKREDINIIDKSITLKNSLVSYKDVNTLNLAQSGNTYHVNGMYPISQSGYLYTGNTIGFMNDNIVKIRHSGSGIFDARQSGNGNIIQAGIVSTAFKFTNRGLNFLTDYINVRYYGIDSRSGIFKSSNETGFFKNKSGDLTYKTGVYNLLSNNLQNYLSKNYNELSEKTRYATSTHPTYYIYKEAIKEKLGFYGATNPFYLKSGFVAFQRFPASFYLFAYTNNLDTNTNTVNITGISLVPINTFKDNTKQILDLGPTSNYKYTYNTTTNVYDKSN
jgi:hypothetical protein